MKGMSRRRVITGMAGATVGMLVRSGFTQSQLSESQKGEYARQFATGATGAELSVLRDIQEKRIAVPSSVDAAKRLLKASPAMAAMESGVTPELGMLMFWNGVALEATSLDHTNDNPSSPPPTYAEQFGPTRSSRALAIVHIAICEAVNTIFRKYTSYKNFLTQIQQVVQQERGLPIDQITPAQASVNRAILEAAYVSLAWLHPNKQQIFDAARTQSKATIGDPIASQDIGAAIGVAAAKAIIAERSLDGSFRRDLQADDLASNNPLDWRKDDISKLAPALGANWHYVTPFVIESASKHRVSPPPKLADPEFIAAYKEVRKLGGDPHAPAASPRWPTPTQRTGTDASAPLDDQNETFKAIFWAYDGTALLCAPPRLYNQVATSIALKEKEIDKVEEMARYLALVNVAMADAGIAAWESKYYYSYARPVTAIRRIAADTTSDGAIDPNWTPLGAPVSNGRAENANLTPPFPAYPSGHATFGGALFHTMRLHWGMPMEGVPFDFVSDEYNGRNRGPGESNPRPLVRRHFDRFDDAEKENGKSRIWLGIHWQFDADSGIAQGRAVADEVYTKLYK